MDMNSRKKIISFIPTMEVKVEEKPPRYGKYSSYGRMVIQLGKVEGCKGVLSCPIGRICTTEIHSQRTCFVMVDTTCLKEKVMNCFQDQE